jgi:4-hydroxybenzoate polyprenyltransferase
MNDYRVLSGKARTGTMNNTYVAQFAGLSRLKLFLALSRTPHGILDLATPLLAALLWLGDIPAGKTAVLGIIAAFAGYTAVYALNDIVDYQTDREKIRQEGFRQGDNYLDSVFVRHPLAQGMIAMPEALAWAGGWALLSLATAYLLNPVCAYILIVGCVLEIIYCLLFRVSRFRTLVSGVVKTLGGLAAVFAVDRSPDPALLLLLFFWLFFWEIGGQNVVADWHDIEEDRTLGGKTIPVFYGTRGGSIIVLVTLTASVVLSGILLWRAPLELPLFLYIAGLAAGIFLLLLPALRLYRSGSRDHASALFNSASYYPASLLVIVALALFLR